MNKSFQKSQSRRAFMDSIAVPDTEKIQKLSDPKFHGSERNRQADAIFEGNKFNKVGDFDRATKFYGSAEEKRLELEKDDPDDFIPKRDPNRKAPGKMNMGVKVGSTYVKRKKVVMWIVIAVILLACALLFLPPLMTSNSEDTKVIYDRNVFENMGMTEFKTYALANYSVYSEEAFSSEKKENYRVVSMNVHLQNTSPFEVSVGQVEVTHVPKAYEDKICYVTLTRTDKDGAITNETVPGFSGKDITIEVMVNVTDMTDEQFDEAITGLILSTKDTKKRIAMDKYIPSIPAFLFVSDNVSVSVDTI